MKKKFSYLKEFIANYEIHENNGIKTITVEIPKIGKKSTQLGNLSIEFLTKDLANGIFSEWEEK